MMAFAFRNLPLLHRTRSFSPKRNIVSCSSTNPYPTLPKIPRRILLLSVLPLLFPRKALARKTPKEPLSISLQPIVRVRDALSDLGESVDVGTNGDLRRVVRVLLVGSDLPRAARNASLWLAPDDADKMQVAAREGNEYLNQIIAYFDPVANKDRPKSEMLAFCRRAIDAAAYQLDVALGFFEPGAVAAARDGLRGPV